MTITSDVLELQQVILTNLGGFYPDVLNGVFDRSRSAQADAAVYSPGAAAQ